LGVIRQEAWILDHFEIFLTIALLKGGIREPLASEDGDATWRIALLWRRYCGLWLLSSYKLCSKFVCGPRTADADIRGPSIAFLSDAESRLRLRPEGPKIEAAGEARRAKNQTGACTVYITKSIRESSITHAHHLCNRSATGWYVDPVGARPLSFASSHVSAIH